MNDFPKTERLCNYHSIQALFKEGKSIKKYPLKLIYLPLDKALTPSQVLISVPKKKLKRAVDRNRIKRLIRESYRKQKHQLSSQDKSYSLALIYMSDELASYEQIYALVGTLLKQLSLSA
ncbi:ribonuclease P protein component [Capnocytophaga granulosa]|jgi:ribonuclease P protein component|uniref:Ribonuclease P protein component n=1 Tax=Capnocytophaga granulosa TaxID=45242 RepID=A0A1H2RCT7_9FLAO|nr:ribonuclease P protein component [Capnocytophaga granulosa]EPD29997.1 ribonuclease P protein component [Capnocytophaga granulosa ATCC 51502]SDW17028.1 ribonuclease P protein component [Capnocytophaga granulosa]SUX21180.1 Ribonuclease P protein component [Capnocytophaga granulosa]